MKAAIFLSTIPFTVGHQFLPTSFSEENAANFTGGGLCLRLTGLIRQLL
jgi:hypothetical protein